MSISRSAANVRQLRSTTTEGRGVPLRPGSSEDVATRSLGPPLLASLNSFKSRAPPLRPSVAWEDDFHHGRDPETAPAPKKSVLSKSNLHSPPIWPPQDFTTRELPAMGTTQIMAVRIDKAGAPLGQPNAPGAVSLTSSGSKKKARAVTIGGWRTGVTAVKFSRELFHPQGCMPHSFVTCCIFSPMCYTVGRYMDSGITLGQPRTLLWADAAKTVPLRNINVSYWDIPTTALLELSSTHTSIVELETAVGFPAVHFLLLTCTSSASVRARSTPLG